MDEGKQRGLLTLKEFTLQSRLSASTVRRRVRDGSLPFIQVGGKGKKLLFPADALVRVRNQTASAVGAVQAELLNPPPSTGAQADIPAGPRPRWARKLARRLN